ncbi:hypothetical protein LY10_01905 [Planktotalea frisia]|uniref:Glutamine amidotransferase domain-containing protein n=1 Tax=Planktotalea frisia TaxID=696762 RepID=A0A1L9NXW6_9RHOB|nr:hypothetical protein [Planktotalea frisia]OJI94107.1 hypothetical protein PFRI_16370 [Planktotalea frisia]PZX29580.1 hypothetical protein LY10_01905 [Planktotalea frisia]
MTQTIVFDPLVPLALLIAAAVVVFAGLALALWRGLAGAWLRGLGGVVVIAALAGPNLQREERGNLNDIVVIVSDESASQKLAERAEISSTATDRLEQTLMERDGTDVVRVTVPDGQGDAGTQLLTALNDTLAELPQSRIAGAFLVSDGRLHDLERAPDMPAPLHLLMSGKSSDWDRRLSVTNAPAFAILGEPVTLTLKIEDMGAAPAGTGFAPLEISIDGGPPQRFEVPVDADIELPLTLPHGGRNVIQFTVPSADGELTDRNNTALIQMNGVRDRLRVLLVSGEPHPGGRTWRNLLKSDSSVDLVHFTILRPPEKQDGVPTSELSLIAFPTRELFLEKIEDFDLIIFDRYKRRGILPTIYLDNVVRYVQEGGAVLVAAGPDFASADSIYRSPLAEIMPAAPTARVIEQGFRPTISDLGNRHPVTAGLPDTQNWGRWMRQIEVEPSAGDVIMTGVDDKPLLILNRVGEGRVSLIASDHAWLWNRGFEGGGPQLELLRRLAHWMMGEPELEEDALLAEATGQNMRIARRTLKETAAPFVVTSPDGSTTELSLSETAPGRFETQFTGAEIGLYRLNDGTHETVIGLGPAAPREFEKTIATAELLQPLIDDTRGGVARLEDGIPTIRTVREGRPAAGRGWLGITPRGAYETLNVRQTPLLPAWLVLLLASGLILAAWLREGRR